MPLGAEEGGAVVVRERCAELLEAVEVIEVAGRERGEGARVAGVGHALDRGVDRLVAGDETLAVEP